MSSMNKIRQSDGALRQFRRVDNEGIIPTGFSFQSKSFGVITKMAPGKWSFHRTTQEGEGECGIIPRYLVLRQAPDEIVKILTNHLD